MALSIFVIVAPSSPLQRDGDGEDEDRGGCDGVQQHGYARLSRGIEVLKSFGMKPYAAGGDGMNVIADGRFESAAFELTFLAGDDDVRRRELIAADSEPVLIACAKGGYGAARLLEKRHGDVEYETRSTLLGFSDITALLLSRWTRGAGRNIHGPVLTLLAAEPDWSKDRLRAVLANERHLQDLHGETMHVGDGQAVPEGPLVVANLAVSSALIGTEHFPDIDGCILVLEDVNESPQRVDRMLTHWRLAGLFSRVSGIGFGHFHECGDASLMFRVLTERTADLGIVVIGKLPVGHHCADGVEANAALPLGWTARLDPHAGTLSVSKPS